MAGRCEHPCVEWRLGDDPTGWRFASYRDDMVTMWCSTCHVLLPQGPANDKPTDFATREAIDIEIRAAEILAATSMWSIAFDGWSANMTDADEPRHFDDAASAMWYHAGWLAHAIASHDTEGDAL